jgi:hypothetical protein
MPAAYLAHLIPDWIARKIMKLFTLVFSSPLLPPPSFAHLTPSAFTELYKHFF